MSMLNSSKLAPRSHNLSSNLIAWLYCFELKENIPSHCKEKIMTPFKMGKQQLQPLVNPNELSKILENITRAKA